MLEIGKCYKMQDKPVLLFSDIHGPKTWAIGITSQTFDQKQHNNIISTQTKQLKSGMIFTCLDFFPEHNMHKIMIDGCIMYLLDGTRFSLKEII